MRYKFNLCLYAFALCALFSLSKPVYAQEIVSEPICFMLVNEAPHTVFGSFVTDHYVRDDGIKTRHRSNFRLQEKGAVDPEGGYPVDRAEFCSYGPFLPGRQLHLTLRTLVPVFSCRTSVEKGPIIIKSEPKPEGGTKMWAECL